MATSAAEATAESVEPEMQEQDTFDWAYLFELYPKVDAEGPLMQLETSAAQMQRVAALQASSPSYASALVQNGMAMTLLARNGDLEGLHELLGELHRDEILGPFLDRAFTAACKAGQLHIVSTLLPYGLWP